VQHTVEPQLIGQPLLSMSGFVVLATVGEPHSGAAGQPSNGHGVGAHVGHSGQPLSARCSTTPFSHAISGHAGNGHTLHSVVGHAQGDVRVVTGTVPALQNGRPIGQLTIVAASHTSGTQVDVMHVQPSLSVVLVDTLLKPGAQRSAAAHAGHVLHDHDGHVEQPSTTRVMVSRYEPAAHRGGASARQVGASHCATHSYVEHSGQPLRSTCCVSLSLKPSRHAAKGEEDFFRFQIAGCQGRVFSTDSLGNASAQNGREHATVCACTDASKPAASTEINNIVMDKKRHSCFSLGVRFVRRSAVALM
jgi:hypothetical protein